MEGLQISQHAKERYAERIMNKADKIEIAAYVNTHEDKIHTDISKMVEFGTKIYEGNTSNQTKTSYVIVYLNGTWIVLVDPKQNKVITIYTVGKEFNDAYISLIKDKIKNLENDISIVVSKLEENNKDLKESIIEEENEYKNLKKELNRIQERIDIEKQMIESNNFAIIAEKDKMKTFINEFLKRKVL